MTEHAHTGVLGTATVHSFPTTGSPKACPSSLSQELGTTTDCDIVVDIKECDFVPQTCDCVIFLGQVGKESLSFVYLGPCCTFQAAFQLSILLPQLQVVGIASIPHSPVILRN